MKLATLRNGGPDGTLVVVSGDLTRAARVPEIAATLQGALDDWDEAAPRLAGVYRRLGKGTADRAFPFDVAKAAAPLPRAYQWLDGSAYLHHVELVRKARGAAMPADAAHDPLMYQGGSDGFLGPRDPIVAEDEGWGIDLEAELAVVTGDVPAGVDAQAAAGCIRLFMLLNDVTLRNLVPAELAKGFGFLHSKPPTAFAPVAVTPDELGPAWRDGRVHLVVESTVNDEALGRPDAGVGMQFGFPELIAHAARTRPLGPGTIVGSGTISNDVPGAGSSCLVEKRALETIASGKPSTPFLRFGDHVRIDVVDAAGRSVFGAIEQVVAPSRSRQARGSASG